MSEVEGLLVLVATPIGNLGDLSPRAAATLGGADVIACEDTRRTRKLLTAAGIGARALVAVHEHNEAAMVPAILDRLRAGQTVAVVSDAGTPGISDPGQRLVEAAIAGRCRVEAVPGPSAAVTALVISGLTTRRWCFEGFLPRKGKERSERLEALKFERRTTVLYEAPHRLAATLVDLAASCGDQRRVAIARELTKMFADTWRGTLGEAVGHAADPAAPPRGEYVVVLEGAAAAPAVSDQEVVAALVAARAGGTGRKDAVAEVASALGVPRRRVYELALGLTRDE